MKIINKPQVFPIYRIYLRFIVLRIKNKKITNDV